MRHAQRRLWTPLFKKLTNPSYGQYISNVLSAKLWYTFDDTATPAVNHGTLNGALNGTVANVTFGAAGPNGIIPKAYTYNGTTSLLTIPTSAGLESADFTIACLVNESSKGESNLGTYFELYTTAPAAAILFRHSNSLTQFVITMTNAAGTGQSWVTSEDVSFDIWSWLFVQFNSATGKVKAWKSVSSVLTAFTMGTDPTFSGVQRLIGSGYVGNASDSTRTLAGKYAQFAYFTTLLSTTEMQNIITKSGV